MTVTFSREVLKKSYVFNVMSRLWEFQRGTKGQLKGTLPAMAGCRVQSVEYRVVQNPVGLNLALPLRTANRQTAFLPIIEQLLCHPRNSSGCFFAQRCRLKCKFPLILYSLYLRLGLGCTPSPLKWVDTCLNSHYRTSLAGDGWVIGFPDTRAAIIECKLLNFNKSVPQWR